MSREIMQQALNALLISAPLGHAMEDYEYRHKVIKDIEAELAKPEREWVGLTQEERDELLNYSTRVPSRLIDWTEQKLKEKNGAL